MNPMLIAAFVEIGKAALPELVMAIKRLRQDGVLTDEQIAETEVKRGETLEKMERDAGIPPL